MSVTVTGKSKVTCRETLEAASDRIGTKVVEQFNQVRVPLRLDGWQYDIHVRFDLQTGNYYYDSDYYGLKEKIGNLLQAYELEGFRLEAQRLGYTIASEYIRADGSIEVEYEVPEGLGAEAVAEVVIT